MNGQTVDKLKARNDLLRAVRGFFYDRGFMEVETPLLFEEIIPEQHIEPYIVRSTSCDALFLQASPELCMKRLLTEGAEAIFQITRSFRAGERGLLHRPEFTILEWYRRGDNMQAGMTLLDDFCQAMLDTAPAERISYQAAFQEHAGICPLTCTTQELMQHTRKLGKAFTDELHEEDRDELLNVLLAYNVEPHLGHKRPTILYDYPVSQASLAQVRDSGTGPAVAERFELYVRGVELANGFHELADSQELRTRLERVNRNRAAGGRQPLPLPESLLAAMNRGLPECTGVALGFDRLLMLAAGAGSIAEVTSFVGDDV